MHKTLTLALLTLTLPSCALFAGGQVIATASDAACSTLLPPEWEEDVPAPDLPLDDSYGSLAVYADATTGALGVANGIKKAAIGIVRRCEERDARAIKRAKRGALRRMFD